MQKDLHGWELCVMGTLWMWRDYVDILSGYNRPHLEPPVITTRSANKLVGTLRGNWKLGTFHNLNVFLSKGVRRWSSEHTCGPVGCLSVFELTTSGILILIGGTENSRISNYFAEIAERVTLSRFS